MEVEQLEILTFLKDHVPFRWLPDDELTKVATQIDVSYFRAGATILEVGQTNSDLHIVRSGAVEIYLRNGELYNRLGEGGMFGQQSVLTKSPVRFPTKALDDTLIYFIPYALFIDLFDRYERFSDFVELENNKRLSHTVTRRQDANELMTSPVSKLITREQVAISEMASVKDAAFRMTEEGVSCLLVVDASDATAIPKHNGTATKNTIKLAGPSLLIFLKIP